MLGSWFKNMENNLPLRTKSPFVMEINSRVPVLIVKSPPCFTCLSTPIVTHSLLFWRFPSTATLFASSEDVHNWIIHFDFFLPLTLRKLMRRPPAQVFVVGTGLCVPGAAHIKRAQERKPEMGGQYLTMARQFDVHWWLLIASVLSTLCDNVL